MSARLLLAFVLLGITVVACTAAGPGCPCGLSYDTDPNSGDALAVPSDHDLSVHCFCSCGEDPAERLPPSADCRGFEGPCETRAGSVARYTCE